MAQVSPQPLNAEAGVRTQGSPFEPSTLVYPCQYYCTIDPHSFRLHVAFSRMTNGRSLGTLQKKKIFESRGVSDREVLYWNGITKTHPANLAKYWIVTSLNVWPSSHDPESSSRNLNTRTALVILVSSVSCSCVGDTLGNKRVTALL